MTENKTAGAPEPRVAFGRALVDFRIEGATTPHGLLPAEEKLVAAAARGEWCTVSGLDWTKEGDLKKLKKDEQYHVRPEVLRCLALGADAAAPVHEKGIQILGAFIPGDLDLEDAELCRPLWLQQSYFDGSVILRNARMSTLSIGGSRIAGLEGDRAKSGRRVPAQRVQGRWRSAINWRFGRWQLRLQQRFVSRRRRESPHL
jgi:hypothetical protein